MLLAWDTSTDTVTVALHDGKDVVAHGAGSGVRRHAEVLTPLLAEVLAEGGASGRDLDRIVVGVGPGAYTGLRVGLVTAAALGETWGLPVVGACSLDALAVEAVRQRPQRCRDGLLVVTDARRRQVFWARYDAQARRVGKPSVADPADVDATGLAVVGSGALAHPHVFPDAEGPATPDAAWMARGVVDGVVAEQDPAPMYLRAPDVTRSAGPKDVLQPGRSR